MPKRKPNHKGMRSCLGCGARDKRGGLLRIAAVGDHIELDTARRLPGRGGYLHPQADCLARFVASRAKEFRSLKRKVNRDERLRITGSIKDVTG
jgi:predicted RNA-binding protein YlxR (DUF448 family)